MGAAAKQDVIASLLAPSRRANNSPRQKDSQRWLSRRVLSDTWIPETFAITCSMVCSMSIGVVLEVWSGKPVPVLKKGITLNAIISVLATISKSAMLYVVATCLAQSKWTWFRKPRVLGNIQTFDDASRGPLGSILLLADNMAFSSASLGAIITVFALAFDPFVQQALVYPYQPMSNPTSDATVSRSVAFFNRYNTDDGGKDLAAAVSKAVWADGFDQQQPLCPALNCTWDILKTIGICHKCQTVTPTVLRSWNFNISEAELLAVDDTTNVTIEVSLEDSVPRNLTIAEVTRLKSSDNDSYDVSVYSATSLIWLVDIAEQIGSLGPYQTNISVKSYLDVIGPELVMGFSEVSWGDMGPALKDTELCVLDLCLRTYNVSVTNGKTKIDQIESSYGIKHMRDPSDSDYDSGRHCWSLDNQTNKQYTRRNFSKTLLDCPYDEANMSFCTCAAQNWFDWWIPIYDKLNGVILSNATCSQVELSDGLLRLPINPDLDCQLQTNTTPFTRGSMSVSEFDRVFQDLGPNTTMQNMADSLTKLSLDTSWVSLPGSTIQMVQHVQVRWYWLVLPALLNLLAAVFLILTMRATERQKTPLWKTSLVTTFFHGLDHEVDEDDSTMMVSEMHKQAKRIRVQLRKTEITQRMVFGKADKDEVDQESNFCKA